MQVNPSDVRRVRRSPDSTMLVVVYRINAPRPQVGDVFVWEGQRHVMTQLMWPRTTAFGAVALFAVAPE